MTPSHLISIAGGGVAAIGPVAYLALGEAVVCNRLHKARPTALIGNSGGAIDVAMLAVGMHARDCVAYFDRHQSGIFGDKQFQGRFQMAPKYNDAYAMDQLKRLFPMTLGELKGKHIFITAWNAVTRDIKVFSSEDDKDSDIPLWSAVRASMAAPTYFDPIGPYYDGGLCCNDPAMVGADAIRALYGSNIKLKVAQFVTSGKQPDSTKPKKGMSNVTTLTKVVVPAVTQGNSAHVNFSLKANGHDVFRIRPEHHDYTLDDINFSDECRGIWEQCFLDCGGNFVKWWFE